jgi:hypothetical protein
MPQFEPSDELFAFSAIEKISLIVGLVFIKSYGV